LILRTLASDFGQNKTYCWLHLECSRAAICSPTCWTTNVSTFRYHELVLRISLATTSRRLPSLSRGNHITIYDTSRDTLTNPTSTLGFKYHHKQALTPFQLRLVLDTLTPLPSSRKCFRMINGVLVERTVGDVLPQLQSNSDNMNKVLVELAKQYKTKQDDMEKWKVSQSSSSMLVNQSREKRELVANDSFNLQKKNKIQVVQQ
jgi:hypothetical protein